MNRERRANSRGKRTAEFTPEETALIFRVGVFVKGRWLAIGGIVIAVLLATRVFNISFPVFPVFIICGIMALYNLLLFWQFRSLIAETEGSPAQGPDTLLRRLLRLPEPSSPLVAKARATGNAHIIFDLLALTALLHFTGGIENPFIFFFVFT